MTRATRSKLEWLPTNQKKDFTILSPVYEEVDKELDRAVPPDAEKRDTDKRGRTVDYSLVGAPARIQSCSCYGGRARSLTVRSKYQYRKFGLKSTKKKGTKKKTSSQDYSLISGYHPDPTPDSEHLVSVYETCGAVFNVLGLEKYEHGHGLLIVSGSTNSLKTQLALGLMNMLLEVMMKQWLQDPGKKRKPHLVTCEDNIEQYFIELSRLKRVEECFKESDKPSKRDFWLSHSHMPDYTPRLLKKDTPSLEAAVNDALRMTPAIFYGGEIRKRSDWRQLYRLAQSHLVVVTTHASSIVNTISILRECLKIETAPQRSELASSIFSIIHMRSGKLSLSKDKGVEYVLPSCWIRTPASVTAFAADGMASVVPHFVDIRCRDNSPEAFCIGRRSFASLFIEYAKTKEARVPERHRFKWKTSSVAQPKENDGGSFRAWLQMHSADLKHNWTGKVTDFGKRPHLKQENQDHLLQSAATMDLLGE